MPQNIHSCSQTIKVNKMGTPTIMILINNNFGATDLPTTMEGVRSRAGPGFRPGGFQLHVQYSRSQFFLACYSQVTET